MGLAMHDPAHARGGPVRNVMGGLNVMTATQLTRGVALRRYAFGKPVQQIADEAGLRYDQVLGVLKGEPVHIDVAARLTGYLRTPCSLNSRLRDRRSDRIESEGRRALMRRFVRMRHLARALGMKVGYSKAKHKVRAWTDGELRTYCYNAEDGVKWRILELYPSIAEKYKFSDYMQPWEYLERIDQYKTSREARAAVANHARLQAAKVARQRGGAAA